MKNLKVDCFGQWVAILLLSLTLANTSAQNEPINRGGLLYYEIQDSILNFEITISHDTIKSLIDKICPNLDSTTFQCNNQKFGDVKLEGFSFIPIWEIKDIIYFNTSGYRLTLVFSTPDNNRNPPKLSLAGFEKIEHAFSPIAEKKYNEILKNYTIEVKMANEQTNNITFDIFPYDSSFLSRANNTRELDFTFLSYRRYLSLATKSNDYSDFKKGISMTHCFIGLKDKSVGEGVIQQLGNAVFTTYSKAGEIYRYPLINGRIETSQMLLLLFMRVLNLKIIGIYSFILIHFQS